MRVRSARRRRGPLRVVVLDHTAELGGAELALVRLLDALAGRDDLVVHVVLLADGPLVARLEGAGHSVEVLPLRADIATTTRHEAGRSALGIVRRVAAAAPFVVRLTRRLRALHPDVIHTTSLKANLLAVPVARALRKPLVWQVHDRISPDYLPQRLVDLLRRLARTVPRAVLANSHATAHTLPGAGAVVVHPGLTADEVRDEQRPRPPVPVIGMLGRIAETKGQLELVRATARVVQVHPEAEVRIIGSALFGQEEYEQAVRAEIHHLGLEERVRLVGFAEDPREALDGLSVMVHASTVPEPYGQVVAEAMARGVPVVASRAGGVLEVVGDGEVGWLVEPGDVEGLSAAIVAALDDPVDAEHRGMVGLQRARTSLRIDRTAETVAAAWRRVADRPTASERPRVVIAHDYLTQRGGAERVVLAMARAYPGAPIWTTLYHPEGTYPELAEHEIVVSPLNRVGALRRDHRAALPLLAWAAGRLRIDADVVIASSSGWAHGVATSGRLLVYCHAPARWLYQSEAYLGASLTRSPEGLALLALRPWLRRWDRRAAARADVYLANSRVVASRVEEAYGLRAKVVPPPFAVTTAGDREPVPGVEGWAEGGYVLVVSRLLPYKHVGVVVDAVASRGDRLLVIGDGPLRDVLAARTGAGFVLAHGLSDAQMRWAYDHARVLVAPSHEDFGLTPLEAAAFGVPTVALHAGGYLDTVDPEVNGVFFGSPTPGAITGALAAAEVRTWDRDRIRRHADLFSEERFHAALRVEVERLLTP